MSNAIPEWCKTVDEAREYLLRHGYSVDVANEELANWTPDAASIDEIPEEVIAEVEIEEEVEEEEIFEDEEELDEDDDEEEWEEEDEDEEWDEEDDSEEDDEDEDKS